MAGCAKCGASVAEELGWAEAMVGAVDVADGASHQAVTRSGGEPSTWTGTVTRAQIKILMLQFLEYNAKVLRVCHITRIIYNKINLLLSLNKLLNQMHNTK